MLKKTTTTLFSLRLQQLKQKAYIKTPNRMSWLFALLFLLLPFSNSFADNVIATPLYNTTGLISHDTMITIPGTSKLCGSEVLHTIQTALRCLGHYKISSNATVTILVHHAVVNPVYKTITVNHADGDHIHIVGDCAVDSTHTTGACDLYFAAGNDGLVVQNGHKLGLFDNFNLYGTGSGAGIYANTNSNIILGHHISVTHFNYDIDATNNSYIQADYANTSGAIEGLVATRNSIISASYAKSENNSDYGFNVQFNSLMNVSNTTADNNSNGSVWVSYNSEVTCYGSKTTIPDIHLSSGSYGAGC